MYCPKCVTLNDERSMNCSRCGEVINPAGTPPGAPLGTVQPYQGQPYPGQQFPGQPYPGQPYPGEIPTYMTQSILVTLLCCMPLGIVGIFKANKISKLIQQSDYAGALKASGEQKTMLWIGAAVGFVITIFYVIGAMNKT